MSRIETSITAENTEKSGVLWASATEFFFKTERLFTILCSILGKPVLNWLAGWRRR